MSAHLENAARKLRGLAVDEWPEHVWIAEVRQGKRNDARRLSASALGKVDPSTVAKDSYPVGKGRPRPSSPAPLDDDHGQKAA